MADLADLVTTDIGIIAFWNALDHRVAPGVGDVTPADCAGVFDSYTTYDNGIEGYKALGSGRYFHARVKTDGWIIAWIDRTNLFGYPNLLAASFGETGYRGYYDILYNWQAHSASISTTQTTLVYFIDLLYTALSNAADFTFDNDAVGHYCYEFPLASALTLLDISVNATSQEGTILYNTGTTIYHASVTGATQCDNVARDRTIHFEGTLITGFTEELGTTAVYFGTADLIDEGWIPAALTDYVLTVYTYAVSPTYAHGSILMIWK